MLSTAQRERYARHILLAEIGEAGQARLCGAHAHASEGADPAAREVAFEYLERAGVRVQRDPAGLSSDEAESHPIALPSPEQVDAFAGRAALRDAAAQLLGAFAAVETVKRIAAVGTPAAAAPPSPFVEVEP